MKDTDTQKLCLAESQQPHRPLEGLEVDFAILIGELVEAFLNVLKFLPAELVDLLELLSGHSDFN